MAAAEYFSGAPLTSKPPLSPPQHSPPPMNQAHPSQQHLNPPYPMSDAPPPYEEISSSHTSAPRPTSSTNNQYRPSPTSQYPDDKPPAPPRPGRPSSGSPPLNVYGNSNARYSRDSLGHPSSSSAPYPQQPLPPTSHPAQKTGHLRPDYNPNFPNASTSNLDPYGRRPTSTPPKLHGILKNKHESTPYYEPSRSRSRSSSRERHSRRSHHRHGRHNSSNNVNSSSHQRYDSHHNDYPSSNSNTSQQVAPQKKGNSVKTFLGAGGGAIIGDCIFPGLGTIGGAILGGLGGHEYGKRDKQIGNAAREAQYSRSGREPRPRSYSNNDEDYYYSSRERERERERRGRREKY